MTYQVDKFGNDRDGYCFYEECDYIRASEVCFFEKQFIKAYFCDIHHCTSTLSGKAESYNELHKFSKASLFCQDFVKSNGKITVEDDTDWEEEYGDDISSESQEAKPYFWEMSRYFQILVVKRVNPCISGRVYQVPSSCTWP